MKKFFVTLLIVILPLCAWAQSADDFVTVAEAGNKVAQFNLGICYENGVRGVDKNRQKAAYWFQRSAEQGYAMAQCKLGLFYAAGSPDFAPDKEKAVYWFEQAANQGLSAAQYALGHSYLTGVGVAENKEKAVYWLEQSANQNDMVAAQCELGLCYENGDGVAKNIDTAYLWYVRALENTANGFGYYNAVAAMNLGNYYFDYPDKRDPMMAESYYQKAYDSGQLNANQKDAVRTKLKLLAEEKGMSASEVETNVDIAQNEASKVDALRDFFPLYGVDWDITPKQLESLKRTEKKKIENGFRYTINGAWFEMKNKQLTKIYLSGADRLPKNLVQIGFADGMSYNQWVRLLQSLGFQVMNVFPDDKPHVTYLNEGCPTYFTASCLAQSPNANFTLYLSFASCGVSDADAPLNNRPDIIVGRAD